MADDIWRELLPVGWQEEPCLVARLRRVAMVVVMTVVNVTIVASVTIVANAMIVVIMSVAAEGK